LDDGGEDRHTLDLILAEKAGRDTGQKALGWRVFISEELKIMSEQEEVRALYQRVLGRWNHRDAAGMSALFAEDGGLVGFDGSTVNGRVEIEAHLAPIFASHPTPPFVWTVREVRGLGQDAALLRAVVGMVPPGRADVEPSLNAIQTLVAVRSDGRWRVALFQNTPAAFHGRPHEVEALTAELSEVLAAMREA
jgi:uncharacterized protein (TIGR02246 family)